MSIYTKRWSPDLSITLALWPGGGRGTAHELPYSRFSKRKKKKTHHKIGQNYQLKQLIDEPISMIFAFPVVILLLNFPRLIARKEPCCKSSGMSAKDS